MMPEDQNHSQAIYTAGFSNLSLERFLDNLRTFDIQVLMDVRSKPYARYTPHFNKDQIALAAQGVGLRYHYMGAELGGWPDNPGFYDRQGHVLYERVAAQPWFKQGIAKVAGEVRKGYRVALTCGEDDPRQCHRRRLLGRVLREDGIGVAHILANGTLIAEAELLDEERSMPRQLSLFGEVLQPEWKSAHPVAIKIPGGNASDF